jgi:NADPH:quinone reductase-like Zn-dependent oxidoreductase
LRSCLSILCWILFTGGTGLVGLPANAAGMQAVVISGARLRVETVPRPVPRAGEVLVRIRFAAVNPADWKRANGSPEDPQIGRPPAGRPAIPGLDASGVVVESGPGGTALHVGQPVLLWSRTGGTYAQYVTVPVTNAAPMPPGLDFAQAAGIGHAGLAAWNLLIDVAKIRPEQNVVVLAGAGGVGSAAVQIAHLHRARVTVTASAANADYLRTLGADTVIDYHSQHFEELLRNVDVVLNAVDSDNAYRGLSVLRRGGILASLSGLPAPAQCAARGVRCSGRQPGGTPVADVLRQLARSAAGGDYQVHIDRTFELDQVLQAWSYSQAGHTRGKVAIHVSD